MFRNKSGVIREVAALIIIILLVIAAAIYLGYIKLGPISQPNLPIPFVSIGKNWAGYEVFSSLLNPQPTVNSISAFWTAPAVNSGGSDAFSSVWIGIGGQFDQTLIQVGTEQDSSNGSTNYYAWYEMLPSSAVPITSIQVAAGDQISASISMVNSNTGTWAISIDDQTSNTQFQSNFNYTSQRLSAEWIVERPAVNGALAPLANFGSVTFTNCNADLSGKTGGISSFTHNITFMEPQIVNNRSVQLVSVSGLSNGGTQFKVTYTATGV